MPPGHTQRDADGMWTPVLQRLSGADTSEKESNLSSGQRGDISGRSEYILSQLFNNIVNYYC